MLKRFLSVLIAISLTIIPVMAAENIVLKFNGNAENDLKCITPLNDTKMELAGSYDGKSIRIYGGNSVSTGEITLKKNTQNALCISQSVKTKNASEAQIKILSEGKAFITVALSNNQINASGKSGWVRLRSYPQSDWCHIQINVNFASGSYEVLVDGIKSGGTVYFTREASFADAVEYSVYKTKDASLYIDDVELSGVSSALSKVAGGDSVQSRNAYYRTYKPRYDMYRAPEENIVHGEKTAGIVTASSSKEGFGAEKATDNDSSTVWQAAPALSPADYGKSLNLNKESACDGLQIASYSFKPVKGNIVLEQDILATEVTSQKAIPYMFDPKDGYVATMLINGGNISIAGTSFVYRDISADTWYHIKMEINTATQKYSVYVNDTLLAKDVSFRANCSEVSKLQYHMSGQTLGDLYVDNIKLYYFSPQNSFENVILDEDFENFAEGEDAPQGWTISHSTGGKVSVKSFGVLSEYKFTQYINLDTGRESEFEGAYIEIPEGVSLKYTVATSRKSGIYNTALEKTDKFYSGSQTVYFSPVRAQHLRIIIYDAVDLYGKTVHAQLSEVRIIMKHRYPKENIAFTASIHVSGEQSTALDKRGLTDNIVSEVGRIGDWQSGSENEKWAELTWEEEQYIDRIVLYDSASLDDHTKAGFITFDDGSRIDVTEIKNTGYPKTVDFKPKSVKSVRFTITDFEGSAGLSEFQVYCVGEKSDITEYVEPDVVVSLDPKYASRVVCINDIDNDGKLEYVSAKIYNQPQSENHWCASIGAHREDGSLLWTWGDADAGSSTVSCDVPIQIYDLDNNGSLEIIMCDEKNLIILEGATGKEIKRFPLPQSVKYPQYTANDTIIIADISGKGYPSDIMVKTRYTDVWAYTSDWELIWHICEPDGMKVGHYPQPIDIDNDGHDEVIAGFCCVDEDGSFVWKMKKEQYPGLLESGHKDSLEIINFALTGDATNDFIINQKDLELVNKHLSGEIVLNGNSFISADTDGDGKITQADKELLEEKLDGKRISFPNKGIPKEEQRFCMTPCGACNLIMFDGNGNRVWSLDDAAHYETVEKANLGLSDDPFQIIFTNAVDSSGGTAPFEVVDLDGNIVASRYGYIRNRQFNPINWLGEGKEDFLLLPTDNIVVDGEFNVRVKPLMPYRAYDTLGMKSYQTGSKKYTCDMDGDGTTDIVLLVHEFDTIKIYTYYNKNGAKVADAPGRGYNISQY